jgi:hypothetical protein
MASIKSLKNPDNYFCEYCNYDTCSKKDFNKHLLTAKHQKLVNASKTLVDLSFKKFICNCGKSYAHDSSYYRHKKICAYKDENITTNIVREKEQDEIKQEASKNEINFDKELIMMLINQNKELLEIVKNGTHNTTNNTTNTHTNSHNKAFNLNFFLNETCKNAMNITDFVDSIKLQLTDLMEVGELGYVEGISKIIVKNLNNLDETIRPVHCTDKKRETMYVKDEGEWAKEDDNKTRLKKAINKVADKNIRLLPQFREKYPEYKNSSSKMSDKHDKIVIEVMETDDDKKDKIIKNISKVTIIKDDN